MSTSAASLRLAPVTPGNFAAVCALSVRPDQEHLVSPVVKSLAEAYAHGETAWPRAIVDGDEVVGFVMAFLDIPWNPAEDPRDIRSGLWRLNISAAHQSKGYGRFAVTAVTAELRRRGASHAYVTWHPGPGTPEPFYLSLGFRPTGEQSDGETVAVLDLAHL
ncbi:MULTISPECIES: GNAT family N-acetyltransferase [unclassified Streptomyces]|uniref:GNAT family N-acetyltransferase n=1 Tax=unclassified Streptomyces TaxID=2593676 RepID=UPI002030B4EE|nr:MULTISPECIES: GNAT family N-acetyltransferase [unclassified Streptomyces]MCM1970641.1 GNAT family N-acetyltransferase [Streptomyces sp. G1]MCX5130450.1 GNAT family N-acetyltransferase [Streptomyces sp. NBC_00347]MCX5301831.1 GNAT family N-acetyltransferase [Streptomyces sp. NBC_00193]